MAMYKDNKLRLLMTLVGLQRLGIDDEPGATWIIPSSLSSKELGETAKLVENHELNPKTEYGDEDNPITPEDLLRRKALVRSRAEYDDDSGDDDAASNGDEDFLFPAGGPTVRKSDALETLKKKRRQRVTGNDVELSSNEETREARRKAREEANLEKRKKIKSDLFIHDSDEDEDEERDRNFFAQEEKRRKGQSMRVLEALRSGNMEGEENVVAKGARSRKRKPADGEVTSGKRRKGSALFGDSDDDVPLISGGSSSPMHGGIVESSEDVETDTPLSSQHPRDGEAELSAPHPEALAIGSGKEVAVEDTLMADTAGDDSDEDAPVIKLPRSRARGPLIIDSDSD